MTKINIKNIVHKILKIIKWIFLILVGAFIILTIVRIPHVLQANKTAEQVAIIHSTKLSRDDVMGNNLPLDPGVEADKTVQGIDANKNGIRDDVELAIFKEYPKSAKTRAVLLQYAMALQMEFVQPFVNEEVATATAEKESQSYDCIGEIVPRSDNDLKEIKDYKDFVKNKQLNTIERNKVKKEFDSNTRSFILESGCDIDLSKLLN